MSPSVIKITICPPTLTLSQDLYTQCLTLLYPWQGPARDTALIVFPPDAVTLRDPDILEHSFWFSPAECKICPKPHFTHEAIPAASFTIILSCPHHPSASQSPPGPNEAVTRILPDPCKHETCKGNLMVIKHAASDDPNISNQDLPVVDVVPQDFLHVDELVRR